MEQVSSVASTPPIGQPNIQVISPADEEDLVKESLFKNLTKLAAPWMLIIFETGFFCALLFILLIKLSTAQAIQIPNLFYTSSLTNLLLLLPSVADTGAMVMHEFGHIVTNFIFSPFVKSFASMKLINAIGGPGVEFLTLFALIEWAFLDRKRFLAILFIYLLGMRVIYHAWYMSTAYSNGLIPGFLGLEGYHDWNIIFSALGVLNFYVQISAATGVVGLIICSAAVVLALVHIAVRIKKIKRQPAERKVGSVRPTHRRVFLYGVPGVGKTFFAGLLHARFNILVIEGDRIKEVAKSRVQSVGNQFLYLGTCQAYRAFGELTPENVRNGLLAVREALCEDVMNEVSRPDSFIMEAAFLDPALLKDFGRVILLTTLNEKRHFQHFFTNRERSMEANEEFEAARMVQEFLVREATALGIQAVDNDNLGELLDFQL